MDTPSNMNRIYATITESQSTQELRLVHFRSKKHSLAMVSLQLDPAIQKQTHVALTTKATNIALAKEPITQLSHANQLSVTIKSIQKGVILYALELLFEDNILESIITAKAAQQMDLKVGDQLTALIQASDLSIAEILS